jgi:sugar phosphate isomerase/epimerase
MNTWIKLAGHGVAWAALATLGGNALAALPEIPDEFKVGGFAIGAQAYTFNRFTVKEAIERTAKAGGKVIEFFPGQSLSPDEKNVRWGHDATDETIAKVKGWLAEAKMKAVNYGVVGIPNDEPGARKVFDFARKLGLRAITTESTESIDLIDKLVKEYNIGVAYHNHPRNPRDPNYKVWDPWYIRSLVEGKDSRIGACVDTGHWCTSGLNPLYCLRVLKGRIVSAHLKDKTVYGEGHDVPYGQGVADIKACLAELKSQGFAGNISIEYEYNWDNNVPEVTQCIDFVRQQ